MVEKQAKRIMVVTEKEKFVLMKINPLPNDKFFDWSQLRTVADDKN